MGSSVYEKRIRFRQYTPKGRFTVEDQCAKMKTSKTNRREDEKNGLYNNLSR